MSGLRAQPLAFERVAFVFPPTGRYCREDRCQSYFTLDLIPSMRPPLEETQGAGGVRRAGGSALMVDAPAEGLTEAQTLERLRAGRPDLVSLTTTFGSLEADLAFARKVRARLGVPVGLRGAPCYTEGEALLTQNPSLDFIVRGDYERVFESIVARGLEAGEGVTWRQGDAVRSNPAPKEASLDALPRPDRSILNPALYRVRGTRRPQATVHVQRGCPFPCTYCLVSTVTGKRVRHRSPEDVAAEMKALWEEGYRDFYLRAETFTLDAAWARATAEAIGRLVPKARWVSATRVDTTDAATLETLARGGCYGLSFGVETGSADIGRRIRKVPNLEETRAVFRACDRAGISSLMYVMLGFLWESAGTLEETARFVRAVRPDLLTFYWAHPYPGTTYYDEVRRAGRAASSERAQAHCALEPFDISTRAIRRRALSITARHYARPSVLASLGRKLGPVLARR